jgi:hypothetical protein
MNKGLGAGGSKTTKNGNSFEELTDSKPFLLGIGFKIYHYKKWEYLFYENDGVKYYWGGKNGFKNIICYLFKNLSESSFFRQPDEYFIKTKEGKTHIYIIEKKNQNVSGSVDIKLLAGPGIVENYRDMFNDNSIYSIHYRFLLSEWLYEESVLKNCVKNTSLKKYLESFEIELCRFNDSFFQETWDWIQ